MAKIVGFFRDEEATYQHVTDNLISGSAFSPIKTAILGEGTRFSELPTDNLNILRSAFENVVRAIKLVWYVSPHSLVAISTLADPAAAHTFSIVDDRVRDIVAAGAKKGSKRLADIVLYEGLLAVRPVAPGSDDIVQLQRGVQLNVKDVLALYAFRNYEAAKSTDRHRAALSFFHALNESKDVGRIFLQTIFFLKYGGEVFWGKKMVERGDKMLEPNTFFLNRQQLEESNVFKNRFIDVFLSVFSDDLSTLLGPFADRSVLRPILEAAYVLNVKDAATDIKPSTVDAVRQLNPPGFSNLYWFNLRVEEARAAKEMPDAYITFLTKRLGLGAESKKPKTKPEKQSRLDSFLSEFLQAQQASSPVEATRNERDAMLRAFGFKNEDDAIALATATTKKLMPEMKTAFFGNVPATASDIEAEETDFRQFLQALKRSRFISPHSLVAPSEAAIETGDGSNIQEPISHILAILPEVKSVANTPKPVEDAEIPVGSATFDKLAAGDTAEKGRVMKGQLTGAMRIASFIVRVVDPSAMNLQSLSIAYGAGNGSPTASYIKSVNLKSVAALYIALLKGGMSRVDTDRAALALFYLMNPGDSIHRVLMEALMFRAAGNRFLWATQLAKQYDLIDKNNRLTPAAIVDRTQSRAKEALLIQFTPQHALSLFLTLRDHDDSNPEASLTAERHLRFMNVLSVLRKRWRTDRSPEDESKADRRRWKAIRQEDKATARGETAYADLFFGARPLIKPGKRRTLKKEADMAAASDKELLPPPKGIFEEEIQKQMDTIKEDDHFMWLIWRETADPELLTSRKSLIKRELAIWMLQREQLDRKKSDIVAALEAGQTTNLPSISVDVNPAAIQEIKEKIVQKKITVREAKLALEELAKQALIEDGQAKESNFQLGSTLTKDIVFAKARKAKPKLDRKSAALLAVPPGLAESDVEAKISEIVAATESTEDPSEELADAESVAAAEELANQWELWKASADPVVRRYDEARLLREFAVYSLRREQIQDAINIETMMVMSDPEKQAAIKDDIRKDMLKTVNELLKEEEIDAAEAKNRKEKIAAMKIGPGRVARVVASISLLDAKDSIKDRVGRRVIGALLGDIEGGSALKPSEQAKEAAEEAKEEEEIFIPEIRGIEIGKAQRNLYVKELGISSEAADILIRLPLNPFRTHLPSSWWKKKPLSFFKTLQSVIIELDERVKARYDDLTKELFEYYRNNRTAIDIVPPPITISAAIIEDEKLNEEIKQLFLPIKKGDKMFNWARNVYRKALFSKRDGESDAAFESRLSDNIKVLIKLQHWLNPFAIQFPEGYWNSRSSLFMKTLNDFFENVSATAAAIYGVPDQKALLSGNFITSKPIDVATTRDDVLSHLTDLRFNEDARAFAETRLPHPVFWMNVLRDMSIHDLIQRGAYSNDPYEDMTLTKPRITYRAVKERLEDVKLEFGQGFNTVFSKELYLPSLLHWVLKIPLNAADQLARLEFIDPLRNFIIDFWRSKTTQFHRDNLESEQQDILPLQRRLGISRQAAIAQLIKEEKINDEFAFLPEKQTAAPTDEVSINALARSYVEQLGIELEDAQLIARSSIDPLRDFTLAYWQSKPLSFFKQLLLYEERVEAEFSGLRELFDQATKEAKQLQKRVKGERSAAKARGESPPSTQTLLWLLAAENLLNFSIEEGGVPADMLFLRAIFPDEDEDDDDENDTETEEDESFMDTESEPETEEETEEETSLPELPRLPTFKPKQERDPEERERKRQRIRSCFVCNKLANHLCKGCKKVFYCSAECQKNDWFNHKQICMN